MSKNKVKLSSLYGKYCVFYFNFTKALEISAYYEILTNKYTYEKTITNFISDGATRSYGK